MSEDLERRVAELEALVDRLAHPLAIAEFPGELDEAELARFRKEFEAATSEPVRVLRPWSLTVLDPEMVRQLLRESVTVVKPGEVLFFTAGDPNWTPGQIREMQQTITGWLEYNAIDIKVIVLPHGEVSVAGDDAA